MSTLSIRIDEKMKREANETFSALGLDMSTAVKMFLSQVVLEQGIPFKPSRNTKQLKEMYDKEVAWALKHGNRYANASEMFKDMMNESD